MLSLLLSKIFHTIDICGWEYAIGFGGVFLNLTIFSLMIYNKHADRYEWGIKKTAPLCRMNKYTKRQSDSAVF